MRTIEKTVFEFDELSDRAKEKAREWYREGADFPWSEEHKGSINAFIDHFGATLKDWNIGPWCPLDYYVEFDNSNFRGVKLSQFTGDEMPTGFCADCDLWGTFYRAFNGTGDAKLAFESAVHAGFEAWREDWEFYLSDEAIDDSILDNGYEFYENGERVLIMRTITKQVFTFDELSDEAKENAREWYRSITDDYYAENVFEDAATIADILGIDLRQRQEKLMNGQTRYDPAIYYSGFWSQGDGACFEGRYRYKAGAVKAIRQYAPHAAELHRIADQLQAVQRQNFYQLTATCTHSGRYCNEYYMAVDVDRADCKPHDAEEDIAELMRDFARWIYRQLETEYEYQTSDEAVQENIRANEYEFYENGERV